MNPEKEGLPPAPTWTSAFPVVEGPCVGQHLALQGEGGGEDGVLPSFGRRFSGRR